MGADGALTIYPSFTPEATNLWPFRDSSLPVLIGAVCSTSSAGARHDLSNEAPSTRRAFGEKRERSTISRTLLKAVRHVVVVGSRIAPLFAILLAQAIPSLALAQPDCVRWQAINPANRPTPRYAHMMAFDSRRNVTVLFGGNLAGGSTPTYGNDTWEYDGTNWTLRTFDTSPIARGTGAMVFDSARGVCVLFGGQDAHGNFGDTWEYDGQAWTRRADGAPAPSPRLGHFMAFDSRRQRTVLFGGWGGTALPGVLLGDTWEWDGTSWQQRFIPGAPLPRVSGAMAFDDIRGKVVMFAGGGNFRATAETWEYDGASWALRFNSVSFWRITPAMAFDHARGRCVAWGGILGNIRYADEFQWDGHAWINFDIPGPIGRSDSVMAYDSARRRVILFGGESQQPARLNDTWELVNLSPIVVTQSPSDRTAAPGQPVQFSVAATGANLSFQWRLNAEAIPGATSPTLDLPVASPSISGRYDVLVSNPCGTTVSTPATLSVTRGDCPADFDASGSVTPDDLADFLAAYFADRPGPAADFDGNSEVTPDDLSDYVAAFFTGCR
jgi:hypothetical protein